jgi:hypothetical protein
MQHLLCKVRIEVVNRKINICYCIFGVYLVTGTKNPDISQEETFRIPNFFISPLGVLEKMAKPYFLGYFLGLTSSPRHIII